LFFSEEKPRIRKVSRSVSIFGLSIPKSIFSQISSPKMAVISLSSSYFFVSIFPVLAELNQSMLLISSQKEYSFKSLNSIPEP